MESRAGELVAGSPAAKPVDELVQFYYLDVQGIQSRQKPSVENSSASAKSLIPQQAGIPWKMFHKEPFSTAVEAAASETGKKK